MTFHLRPASVADSRSLFSLSQRAIADLAARRGYPRSETPDDPAAWARLQPLHAHLNAIADQCWLAEDEAGEVLGYARAIQHGAVQELTEFFVLPGRQAGGLGRELLARAFPDRGGARRLIVATTDERALARYLMAGVYARCPIFEFRRAPEPVTVPTDLHIEPMSAEASLPAALAAIDQALIGCRRDATHAWLQEQRAGFVARRGGAVVGYGYLGADNGPLAALQATDLPALLAHAEGEAHARGLPALGFEVPLINKAAVDHLLARGFQMQPFFALLMSDQPFGRFENYVLFSPPFFI